MSDFVYLITGNHNKFEGPVKAVVFTNEPVDANAADKMGFEGQITIRNAELSLGSVGGAVILPPLRPMIYIFAAIPEPSKTLSIAIDSSFSPLIPVLIELPPSAVIPALKPPNHDFVPLSHDPIVFKKATRPVSPPVIDPARPHGTMFTKAQIPFMARDPPPQQLPHLRKGHWVR
jgi:hypothetical protein